MNTTDCLKSYKNARILWPMEYPDNMIDVVIEKARTLLSLHDVDSEGVAIAENLKNFMD